MGDHCDCRHGWRRFTHDRLGTAAVEMAIVAPVYILLLAGMLAYGIYFGASHSVQQLASDAARVSVAGLSEAERQSLASAFIARNADGYAFVDASRLSVSVAGNASDPTQFEVSVSYDARHLPIWNLLTTLPLPDATITRRSTVRIGGV
jgi:Flp pilus assembly protein TadG